VSRAKVLAGDGLFYEGEALAGRDRAGDCGDTSA
jgi:hypothetical protein